VTDALTVVDRTQVKPLLSTGWVRGLDNDDYHTGPGLSHSGLKRLMKSPWHYFAVAHEHDRHESAPSPQMFAGTLCHCAVLEPNQFDRRYRVGPEVNKNSNAWKEFKAANPGAEIISAKQREIAFAQASALRAHPIVAELLSCGEPELSLYWRDPATDVLCKCRPDWVHRCGTLEHPAAILMDVKTTGDASAEGFSKAVANFGYHTQADWYCTGYEQAFPGVRCEGMVFAVVENEFPYAAAAYMLDEETLTIARERNRRGLNRYAECEAKALWPCYPSELQVISLPRYELMRERAA